MSTNDLIALGWISAGTLGSVMLTVALVDARPLAPESQLRSTRPHVTDPPAPLVVETAPPRRVVDFAIIRDGMETTAGPEKPRTGWSPPHIHGREHRP